MIVDVLLDGVYALPYGLDGVQYRQEDGPPTTQQTSLAPPNRLSSGSTTGLRFLTVCTVRGCTNCIPYCSLKSVTPALMVFQGQKMGGAVARGVIKPSIIKIGDEGSL